VSKTYAFGTLGYYETDHVLPPAPPLSDDMLRSLLAEAKKAQARMSAELFGNFKTIDGECEELVERKALPAP
jgi:hypothetical protein